jgi:hypothetical protein
MTSITIIPAWTATWDYSVSTSLDTTASRTETIYIKGHHASQTTGVVKTVVINICNNEQVSLTTPGTETLSFEVGQTPAEIPSFATLISGFFTSTPTNTLVPSCNTITTSSYSDIELETLISSTAILP